MKNLEELQALRDTLQKSIGVRHTAEGNTKLLVGMATCGIAAGARSVLTAFMKAAEESGRTDITIAQTGCMGICQYEPVVEIQVPGKEKVTYVKVTPERAKEIYEKHVMGGEPVKAYTIQALAAGDANQ